MQLPDSPFRILALAPFTLDAGQPWPQAPLSVDRQGLDTAMQALAIQGFIPLENELCPNRGLPLHFSHFKSLQPDGMIKSIAYLDHLLAAKSYIIQARKNTQKAAEILAGLRQQWPDLPAFDLKDHTAATTAPPPSSSALDNLLEMVALPGESRGQAIIDHHETAQIDRLLQKILTVLFAWPAFRQMEAAWRGLRLLLQQGVGDNVSVEIVPSHPETLEPTLEGLTARIMDRLPSLVLLDLPFDNSPLAMARLAKTAQWAATLMVPVVAWVPATFLQIDDWDQMAALPFLPHHIDQPAFAKYRNLRQSAEGHWVGLTCNRLMVRYPYGAENAPRLLTFNETSKPWIPPVWALGTLVAQSVGQTGWPTHLTQHQQFRIQDLALDHRPDRPPIGVEIVLNRDRQEQCLRAGLTPLVPERDSAFFPQAVCVSGSSLAHQLLICRLTQFLIWCQDHLPAETDPTHLETQLRLAFQVLSEQSRPQAFDEVTIRAGRPAPDGRIPVHFSIVPNHSLLPSRQAIVLELNW
jgi:type VI secretion system protein ImpC